MIAADLRWWLDVASASAIAILAVPVWTLNQRKKRRDRVRAMAPPPPGSFRARLRPILEAKGDRAVADWRRLDEICLWIGYALLLGAALARLFLRAP